MTIRESHTLSEALLFLLIYLREVGKCSSSNGCMSLRYSVIFPRLIWCPKLVILLIKKCLFDRNYAVMTIGRSNMLTWALPIILIYLMKVGKYPSSNGFMSLIRHIITFPKLILAHNLLSCSNFEGLFGRNDTVMTIRGSVMLI